jgi:hypothetical protein
VEQASPNKRTPARKWIVGGAATAVVGLVCSWFIVTFDIPVRGQGVFWFLLVPGGVAMSVFGLGLAAWRRITRKR